MKRWMMATWVVVGVVGSSVYMDEGGSRKTLEDVAWSAKPKELKYMRKTGGKMQGGSMGVKFRNLKQRMLEIRWDDGSEEGVFSGQLRGRGRTATMTYEGHSFFFVDPKNKEKVASFTMRQGTTLYVIEGDNQDDATSLEAQEAAEELKFLENYHKTTGRPWLAYWRRDKPKLNMWPADFVGQSHVIGSVHGYDLSSNPLALKLTVLSHAPEGPRVFLIEDLLSEKECDHVVELGQKVVKQSMVGQGGGFKSKTRTSANGWLNRKASPILNHVYYRFGDVLGINDTLLGPKFNAEELQVVRYDHAQEYAPHHDFGDDGTPQQRFLTLLLYIQLPASGGATSFPKAFNNRGVQVVPKRGDAVLFYNMLPDGNADDLALHAGMPVISGVKWVCNLWVWDPHR